MGNEGNQKPVNPRDAAFIARLKVAAAPFSPSEPLIPLENEDAPQRQRMIRATFEAANQAVGTIGLMGEIRDNVLPDWKLITMNGTSFAYPTSYRFSPQSSHVERGELYFSFFGVVLKNPTEGKIIAVGFAGDSFNDFIYGPEAIDRELDGLSFGVSYAVGAPESDTATLAEAVNAIRRIDTESDTEPKPRYRYFDSTSQVILGKRSSQSIRLSADNPEVDKKVFDPTSGAVIEHVYSGDKTYEDRLREIMVAGLASVFEARPDLTSQDGPQVVTPHVVQVILDTFYHLESLGNANERPYGDIGGQYRAAIKRGFEDYLASRPSLQEQVTRYWMRIAERIQSHRSNRPPITAPGSGRYHTPPAPTFMGRPVIHIEKPFDPDSAD